MQKVKHVSWSSAFAGSGWGPVAEEATAAAALRTLFRLKGLVRDRRCAAMVTVPAGSHTLLKPRLARCSLVDSSTLTQDPKTQCRP